MYGAILGDIIGSPYEFDFNNYKSKDFPLFCQRSEFTDDTVMTLAVAKALLDTCGQDDAAIKAALVHQMQQLGRAYPGRGYGAHFNGWLYEAAPRPYNSYGNGSAMRVSAAAELAKNLEHAASGEAHRRGHAQSPRRDQGRTGDRRGNVPRPHRQQQGGYPDVCGTRVRLRPQPHLR